jgi:hypothetical protein
MSSGSRSHECCRSSQTDVVGAGNEGSANAPTGTATTPGMASVVKNTVAPQSGQKWKKPLPPSSETRMYCRETPSVVTCSASNLAWAPKTLPVRRWQARQWQIETRTGSPSTLSRSCAQLHAACRVLTSEIVDRKARGAFLPPRTTTRRLGQPSAVSGWTARGWCRAARSTRTNRRRSGREELGRQAELGRGARLLRHAGVAGLALFWLPD